MNAEEANTIHADFNVNGFESLKGYHAPEELVKSPIFRKRKIL